MTERLIDPMATVGWRRTGPDRDDLTDCFGRDELANCFCPPHVPRTDRDALAEVSAFTAALCDVCCTTCGARLVPLPQARA